MAHLVRDLGNDRWAPVDWAYCARAARRDAVGGVARMTLRIIALFAVLAVLLVADIAAVYWREAQLTHDR